MTGAPTVATYKGKKATDLTREELIEAYTHVVMDLRRQRDWERQCLGMDEMFADARRRLSQ